MTKVEKAAYDKQYRAENAARLKLLAAERYVANIDAIKQAAASRYVANRLSIRLQQSGALVDIRLAVMEMYGGAKCQLCDESRLGALHIDHTMGNGNQHRAIVGRNSQRFYRWLLKHKPTGFRVLCANHNWLAYLDSRPSLSEHPKSIQSRDRITRLKAEIVQILGGACKCGINDHRVLTVNHTMNNGAEHRRELNVNGGWRFYAAVLKSGSLSGLDCLCFSCNDNIEWNLRKARLV